MTRTAERKLKSSELQRTRQRNVISQWERERALEWASAWRVHEGGRLEAFSAHTQMHTRTHTPHHLWPPASANEILINGLWWRRALRLSCCVTALSPSNSIFPLFSPSFHAFEQPVPPPSPPSPPSHLYKLHLSLSLALSSSCTFHSFLSHSQSKGHLLHLSSTSL